MTNEQKFFLELIKSHLNNAVPPAPNNINYSELFKVCEIQNMTAIAAVELKKLSDDVRPSKEDFSPFNQVLGLTLQSYEYKENGIKLVEKTLNELMIKHTFIKGAALRPLFPVPELRTSGDTDVIVDSDRLEEISTHLKNEGFEEIHSTDIEVDMRYLGEEYEIKTVYDSINDKTKAYFANPFNENLTDANGCNYTLKPLCHLIYLTCHILKHFKSGGAGVRQFADIDVIIRNADIDLSEYLSTCKSLGIEKSANIILSVTKKYLGTPIDTEYRIDEETAATLENVIMNGGVFGYGIGNIGTTRLMRTMNKSGDNTGFASVKAVFGLFAVDKDYLYSRYKYARKHHILLPVAYFSRLFDAVFKRGKRNAKHIKSMFTDRKIASQLSELLNELDIK
ncbi:MAG: hypothetical protein E7571_03240 [Ruminococcaceae bacterium]|nr:hypothetical protein [Oscillospiraceae bacterium]